ncbi:MAG TPA: hypothetical protein VMG09_10040 [Bacteroidota bacterium]|nr:hypothetical protein [Bacteroidota bacterium]
MSWLYAVSMRDHQVRTNTPPAMADAIGVISTPGLFVAVGGNPRTAFFHHDKDSSTGWVVVGLGISRSESDAHILTRSEWDRLLAGKEFEPARLDGHFAVLRWTGNHLECFTDQLGLRALYHAEGSDGIHLSTRIDWLARATDHTDPDFEALGSRWMMFNQVSYASCVRGIERIGPRGYALFREGTLIRSGSTLWSPDFEPDTPEHAEELLRGYLRCAASQPEAPSLGLSGGVDSRLLLSLVSSMSLDRFGVHTFGAGDDPDVLIARRISSTLEVPSQYLHDPLPDVQTCLQGIGAFVSQTLLVEPVTSYAKLRYYPKLHDSGRFLIDGGFGEIARRQYLNRVVRLGPTALRRRDVPNLYRLMRSPRADIFSRDATRHLEFGAQRSLQDAIQLMPAVEKIGVENFVDLLALRTRIPNYGAPEQGRLDAEIINLMPLVQPSFLRAIFGIPPKVRSNAGLYCDMIRRANPLLARFPLAKGGYIHRFGLSSNLSWLSLKLKSRVRRGFVDPEPDLLLGRIREFVFDLSRSSSVASNPAYDSKKVIVAVEKYYGGNRSFRSVVDWWLTFELWRRSLSGSILGGGVRKVGSPETLSL